MEKKTFFEIKNTLRNDIFGEYENSEIGMKILVKGGKDYTVGFDGIFEKENFVMLQMDNGDTIAFVPYENIIAVEA